MLLSEQVRMVSEEEVLVSDVGPYYITSGFWTDVKTQNITLTATKILYVEWTGYCNGLNTGDTRLLLNDVPIIATGTIDPVTTVTRQIYLVLSAGTYTFKFQCCARNRGGQIQVKDIKFATLNFPDKQRNNWDTGNISVPYNTEYTMIQQNFTTPQTRKLAVGSIKKYVAIITLYTYHHTGSPTVYYTNRCKNIGESNESGFYNWRIYINNVQKNWTEKADDYGEYYGEDCQDSGAYGRCVVPLDPNTQYELKITAYNYCGSQGTGRAVAEGLICPWFLADVDYEPVSLDFPQGSTLYVTVEPLHDNTATKYVRVGKQRFKSFGDSTDYYSSLSGTGILNFSYTFETVEIVNSILNVKGLGGCVSIIGVDVR